MSSEECVDPLKWIKFIICICCSFTRLPFDWKTPFGYFQATLAEAIDIFCVVFNMTPVLGFMLGACLLSIAFIEDIASKFNDLPPNEPETMAVKKRFCNVIQLYSSVKELSDPLNQFIGREIIEICAFAFSNRFMDLFNQMYEFMVFVTLAWCLASISCDFLLLQSELVE